MLLHIYFKREWKARMSELAVYLNLGHVSGQRCRWPCGPWLPSVQSTQKAAPLSGRPETIDRRFSLSCFHIGCNTLCVQNKRGWGFLLSCPVLAVKIRGFIVLFFMYWAGCQWLVIPMGHGGIWRLLRKTQLSSFGEYINNLHNSHSILEIRVCLTAKGHEVQLSGYLNYNSQCKSVDNFSNRSPGIIACNWPLIFPLHFPVQCMVTPM